MAAVHLLFINNLLRLHNGSFPVKIKSLIALSVPCSAFTFLFSLITDWTCTNAKFIAGVLVCIAIDHIIGSVYHAFKLRDFTFKKNIRGLLSKLALCAAAAALFEIIHYTVKDASLIYDYLKSLTRLVVVLYPAGSAFMNMSALTNGRFPPLGWINKIKAFNEDLDLDKIRK